MSFEGSDIKVGFNNKCKKHYYKYDEITMEEVKKRNNIVSNNLIFTYNDEGINVTISDNNELKNAIKNLIDVKSIILIQVKIIEDDLDHMTLNDLLLTLKTCFNSKHLIESLIITLFLYIMYTGEFFILLYILYVYLCVFIFFGLYFFSIFYILFIDIIFEWFGYSTDFLLIYAYSIYDKNRLVDYKRNYNEDIEVKNDSKM